MTIKRWKPRDPVEALILIDTLLADLTPRYTRATQALAILRPGHSGRPVGNGEPGGGSGFSTTSIVESSAVTTPETRRHDRLQALPAELTRNTIGIFSTMGASIARTPRTEPTRQLAWVAWAVRLAIRLHQDEGYKLPSGRIDRLLTHTCELADIIDATLGQPKTPQPRDPELAVDWTGEFCRSCLRIGVKEDRSDRYAADGVCRWCGDFQAQQGFTPPLGIVEAHHDGRKITQAMIDAARPKPEKPQRKRRAS